MKVEDERETVEAMRKCRNSREMHGVDAERTCMSASINVFNHSKTDCAFDRYKSLAKFHCVCALGISDVKKVTRKTGFFRFHMFAVRNCEWATMEPTETHRCRKVK